jgi:hypothetical protein
MRIRISILLIFLSAAAVADEPLFKNGYYSISYGPGQNSLRIATPAGEHLVSSTSLYHLLITSSGRDTIRMNGAPATYMLSKVADVTELTWNDSNDFCITKIKAVLNPSSEEIRFSIETVFRKDVQVIRQALMLNITQPLVEVYRKNTLVDTENFQNEYWLGKEGARFGKGNNTFFIYHVPGVSSLQLNTQKNQLIINLDYNKDHPFQHFPLRDSLMHEKEDLSCSVFKAGDVRKNFFSVHAGKPVIHIPRLMLNPNGFPAAHVFTEHADWTDLRTHRAVYFGSEEITAAKKATAGFVKHKIPVTKSVFYSNPDSVLNNQSRHKSIFTTPIANIKGTKGYLKFLQQLKKGGNEICLHTPDQFTAPRALVDEACAYMKKNFNSVSWIDHGYNNGPKNNREAFVCDGLNSSSSSYSKDVWEKYGVKYFWNSYYEDFVTDDSLFFDFNGSIMHPYPGFGDASPTPNYWKHPTRTGNFYSWPTRDLLEMPDPSSWNYHFSTERMNDFVQQRAIKFEHCYPAGSIAGSGFWRFNAENKLIVDPEFDKALQQLASFRDSGLINLTTVRALLDYWIACEQIRFEYPDSATVIITNPGKQEVKGVSFAVSAAEIAADKEFQKKASGVEFLFWLDLKAGESARVSFRNQ